MRSATPECVVWGDGLRLDPSVYDTLRPTGEDIRFHDLEISNHWHVLLNNPENHRTSFIPRRHLQRE
jgi:hypothetical protein